MIFSLAELEVVVVEAGGDGVILFVVFTIDALGVVWVVFKFIGNTGTGLIPEYKS
jgi:hypothetical protein